MCTTRSSTAPLHQKFQKSENYGFVSRSFQMFLQLKKFHWKSFIKWDVEAHAIILVFRRLRHLLASISMPAWATEWDLCLKKHSLPKKELHQNIHFKFLSYLAKFSKVYNDYELLQLAQFSSYLQSRCTIQSVFKLDSNQTIIAPCL